VRKCILASLLLVLGVLSLPVESADIATPAAGVVAMSGQVLVTPPGGQQRRCNPEEVLVSGWKLETRANSSADLLLWDKSSIRITQNTKITIVDLSETENGNFIRRLEVSVGRVWVDAQKGGPQDTFEVKGPQAVAAVKGTSFLVDAEAPVEGTGIQVFEGAVVCSADGVTDTVAPGVEFLAPAGEKPVVASFNQDEFFRDDDWASRNWKLRQAFGKYMATRPKAPKTLNLRHMDPAMKAWMVQEIKRHPVSFRRKVRAQYIRRNNTLRTPAPRPTGPRR
jgi:hypothetical protein